MEFLYTFLITVQVLSAISIVVLVLLQQGKGADMGAAFGSGSAGSVFGSSGSANFLSRSTAFAATIFFSTTLGLAYLNKGPSIDSSSSGGILESIPVDEVKKNNIPVDSSETNNEKESSE